MVSDHMCGSTRGFGQLIVKLFFGFLRLGVLALEILFPCVVLSMSFEPLPSPFLHGFNSFFGASAYRLGSDDQNIGKTTASRPAHKHHTHL